MAERFARRCPIHPRCGVTQGLFGAIHCESGHPLRRWRVVDLEAHKDLGEWADYETPDVCPRGHRGQMVQRADNRGVRCAQCKREWHREHARRTA